MFGGVFVCACMCVCVIIASDAAGFCSTVAVCDDLVVGGATDIA